MENLEMAYITNERSLFGNKFFRERFFETVISNIEYIKNKRKGIVLIQSGSVSQFRNLFLSFYFIFD